MLGRVLGMVLGHLAPLTRAATTGAAAGAPSPRRLRCAFAGCHRRSAPYAQILNINVIHFDIFP
jgi:hypothetical protein